MKADESGSINLWLPKCYQKGYQVANLLLVAPGITTRNKKSTSNKGMSTRNKKLPVDSSQVQHEQ